MPVNSWHEWSHYDPAIDDQAICVTGFTGRGAYWSRQALTPPGKSRRAQRDELRARIEAAVRRDDALIAKGEAAAEVGRVSTAGPPPLPKELENEHGKSDAIAEDRGLW